MKRQESIWYHFSVEGETEKYYLEWLQNVINKHQNKKYKVKFIVRIDKDPISSAKKFTALDPIEAIHVFDYESNDEQHVKQFENILSKMKEVEEYYCHKVSKYHLGYTNMTFELWMILHKSPCNGSLHYRDQYLDKINSAYGKNFLDLKTYKKETNFKNLLKDLTLNDVKEAIGRAEYISKINEEDYQNQIMYNFGYKYSTNNPSLSLHEILSNIFEELEIVFD
ncbi:MAG: RloB domain-containing protein [Acholeplasmataceae bacterium]